MIRARTLLGVCANFRGDIMQSAFFGLHITTSGMNAARANLHTISHNIANAETPGFSRQVAIQQAARPLRGAPGRGMVGAGSQIMSINQIRNQFLDTKFWSQNSVLGQFNTKLNVLTIVQGILHEAPGVGMTNDVNNIFSRMSDLGTNASDLTYRRNFLASMETMAVSLNSQYQQLRQQQMDLNQEMAVTIGNINSLGRQINALNRQISVLELDGSNANDLRDQRALLIDQLSHLVNIEVREEETNADFAAGRTTDPRESRRQLTIILDGHVFVNHFDINQIEVRPRQLDDGTSIARNPEEVGIMYDIFWSNGSRFNMYSPNLSGELAGLIHLRDGNGGNFATMNNTPLTMTSPIFPIPSTSPGGGPFLIPSTHQIRLEFGPNSRVDMGTTGMIQVRDATGTIRNVRYTEFHLEFDAAGRPYAGVFNLYAPDITSLPADPFIAPSEIVIGRTTSYMGIPYFMARLNELARTFAAALNEGRRLDGSDIAGVMGHMHGFDLNGITGFDPADYADLSALVLGYQRGANFSHWDGTGVFNYFNITAANFMVNPELLRRPELLRVSENPDSIPFDNRLALSWGNIATDRNLFRQGRLGDFIASITGDVGVTGRQAENFTRSYTELMTTIDNQRRAISGVSLDEEVAMMVQHQMVFQASARLFTIIDNLYDTLINRMGSW